MVNRSEVAILKVRAIHFIYWFSVIFKIAFFFLKKVKMFMITHCLGLLLLISIHTLVYGSDGDENKLCIGIQMGIIQLTTHDNLLNYYNYQGKARFPFQVTVAYSKNNNIFLINFVNYTSTLHPVNIASNLYAYNYIQHWNTVLTIGFFHEVFTFNHHMHAYLGLENNSSSIVQKEYYHNLLFNDAIGFRKSYAIAVLSLSPMLTVNVKFPHHEISLKTGYSLLNEVARPTDDYVKQTGLPNTNHWTFLGPQKYNSFQFSADYHYEIYQGFGLSAVYNLRYLKYKTSDCYQNLQRSFLLGIFKLF